MERLVELQLLAEAGSGAADEGLHIQRHQPPGLPGERRETEARRSGAVCLQVSKNLYIHIYLYSNRYCYNWCAVSNVASVGVVCR